MALAVIGLFFTPKLDFSTIPPKPIIVTSAEPVPVPVVSYESMSVKEMIRLIAPRFSQNATVISKITWCESGHKVVSHDHGAGLGVTGIHKATFNGWLPKYVAEQGETLNYASTYDQLKMMAWAFSKGSSYRNQWTTYVAYSHGGSYTFYPDIPEKTFTVNCA